MSMLGLLYFSSNFFILPMNLAVLIIGFIFLNTVFYIGLKQFRAIVFIQLLKYPLLFFVVGLVTKDSFIWGLLGSVCFIGHGVLKDGYGKQNTIITLSLFSLPILVKYTLRYMV